METSVSDSHDPKKLQKVPLAFWFFQSEKKWHAYTPQESDHIECHYHKWKLKPGSKNSVVSLGYHLRIISFDTMYESSQKDVYRRKVWRGTWFWKENDGRWITYNKKQTETLEKAFQDGTFRHSSVTISENPGRFVRQHTDENYRQYRPSAKTEGREVVRGYNGYLCYVHPNYPISPNLQIFGVDLETVMHHPTSQGLPVPFIVHAAVNCLFANAHFPELFLQEGIPSRVDELRTILNAGYFVEIFYEDLHILGSLLKNYFGALPQALVKKEQLPSLDPKLMQLSEDCQNQYKQCISQLPDTNKYILKGICSLIYQIIHHHSDLKQIVILIEDWLIPLFKVKLIDYSIMKQHFTFMIKYCNNIFSEVNVPAPIPGKITLRNFEYGPTSASHLRANSEPVFTFRRDNHDQIQSQKLLLSNSETIMPPHRTSTYNIPDRKSVV